jgi:hypothetical protein
MGQECWQHLFKTQRIPTWCSKETNKYLCDKELLLSKALCQVICLHRYKRTTN